ncbi:hypothetical protein BJY01DRAFT_242392 [Aspergillus pseudoustus]|uniref:Xylanolytic transcriptional activator regulatory domain-containing protein n=1 Tax=Aspergillus pseudoustus TaxID=1810923 RepID=A0ABR4KYF2_9EURO
MDDSTSGPQLQREIPDLLPSHGLTGYDDLGDIDPAIINFQSPPYSAGPAMPTDILAESLAEPSGFGMDNISTLDAGLFDPLTFASYMELFLPYGDTEHDSEPSSTDVSDAHVRFQQYCTPMDYSRPASPTAQLEHDKWVRHLGDIEGVQYDSSVLEIFLSLFQVHLTQTFRCFEHLADLEANPLELTLAMAGVGALYCSTPGSHKLAQSLYNSTRVKLLSKVHHKPLTPSDDRLATLQTYMLLELFGYISGDPRLHEIAEVYHWEMVEPSSSSETRAPTSEPTIWSLACLSFLLPWASSNLTQLTPGHMRRREFVESALNQWGESAYNQSLHSTKLLFHLVGLNLHIDLQQAEQIAQEYCAETDSELPQLRFMGVQALKRRGCGLPPSAVFASDIDRLSAAWHANRIMCLALEREQQPTDRRQLEEAPHLPYCIFLAALTFWMLERCQREASSHGESTVQEAALEGPVPLAIDILSHCYAPVAKKLGLIVKSLVGPRTAPV